MKKPVKKTPFVRQGINFYLSYKNNLLVRDFKKEFNFPTIKQALEHILWFGMLVKPEKKYTRLNDKIKNYFDLPRGITERLKNYESEFEFSDLNLAINTVILTFFITRKDR